MRLLRFTVVATAAAAVALALGGALPRAANAASDAAAANRTTFEDSRGEAANAPDITNVVVSNTDAGRITFTINGLPRLVEGMLVAIEIDADNNPATGSQEPVSFGPGADYAIELVPGGANLFRWDGTNFTRRSNDPPQSTLVFSGTELAVSINAAELGSTTRFNFGLIVVTGITTDSQGNQDFTNAQADIAPDVGHGYWNYTVRVAPLRLLARSFSLSPRPPRAGRSLTARLVVSRSDTGAVVSGGRVVCNATVGGRRIAGSGRFVGREARCTWRVPGSARGARIRGSIAVVFEGRRATRSFSATVG